MLSQFDYCCTSSKQYEISPAKLKFRNYFQIRSDGSPFPKRICDTCNKDFYTFKAFLIRLNEGQALLGEQLMQVDNIIIKIPNFLADKRSIFKEKYPCLPKPIPAIKSRPTTKEVLPDTLHIPSKRKRKLPKRYLS